MGSEVLEMEGMVQDGGQVEGTGTTDGATGVEQWSVGVWAAGHARVAVGLLVALCIAAVFANAWFYHAAGLGVDTHSADSVGVVHSGVVHADVDENGPRILEMIPPTQSNNPLVIALSPSPNATLVAPFIRSLRFACPTCRIALISLNASVSRQTPISDTDLDRLCSDNAVSICHASYTPDGWKSSNWWFRPVADWMDSVAHGTQPNDTSSPFFPLSFSPGYASEPSDNFFSSSASPLDSSLVLLAPAPDTIFQKDPFDHPMVQWVQEVRARGQNALVFAREVTATVGDDARGATRSALLTCHPSIFDHLSNVPLSSSEALLGTWGGLRSYVGWMADRMSAKTASGSKHSSGDDVRGYACRDVEGEASALHHALLRTIMKDLPEASVTPPTSSNSSSRTPLSVFPSLPTPYPPFVAHLASPFSHPLFLSSFLPLTAQSSGTGEMVYPEQEVVPRELWGQVVGAAVGWRRQRRVRKDVEEWFGVRNHG
ncbi:hypothetical protein M427DRAFT_160786 [Gonapodya prolifera JEL478]|uniref:Uncharacterized protein n=1 Tax=Gonapodya prolifera (strain JEL478) TaxID=1344416 RepID=A0A138ZXX4_GONPJ|nr:hypothetical protein M427DRAFT_160786 [Gonapodya prolifera JEL478]|eukprot:KXS09348.1 hypothetical protein M427DRAFT_160786 [Gonapodya prolifera JEL478]